MFDASVFLFSFAAPAQEIGKNINFYFQNQSPQFGVQFAYDSDVVWTTTFTVVGNDLSEGQPVKIVAWRIWNSSENKWITDWVVSEKHDSGVIWPGTQIFSWRINDEPTVMAAVEGLAHLKLVFSMNGDEANLLPTHSIDLGKLSETHPAKFSNLTTGTAGCAGN